MNKRYLILKSGPIKAQSGWLTQRKNNFYQNVYDNNLNNMTGNTQLSPEQQIGKNIYDQKNAAQAVLIGTGSNLLNAGADMLYNNAFDKNSRTDGFGNEIFDQKDKKLEVAQSTTSGFLKGGGTGATIGATIGTLVPIPGASLIGAGVGAIAGGIAGLFKGKKKAKEDEEAYNKSLQQNIASTNRSQDMRNSQSLYAKSGTKMSSKKLILKKKVNSKKKNC